MHVFHNFTSVTYLETQINCISYICELTRISYNAFLHIVRWEISSRSSEIMVVNGGINADIQIGPHKHLRVFLNFTLWIIINWRAFSIKIALYMFSLSTGVSINFFTMLGEVLWGILCVYNLWAQFRVGIRRRQWRGVCCVYGGWARICPNAPQCLPKLRGLEIFGNSVSIVIFLDQGYHSKFTIIEIMFWLV
jgi:hypothetical protein